MIEKLVCKVNAELHVIDLNSTKTIGTLDLRIMETMGNVTPDLLDVRATPAYTTLTRLLLLLLDAPPYFSIRVPLFPFQKYAAI
jgi:hypothetical protein